MATLSSKEFLSLSDIQSKRVVMLLCPDRFRAEQFADQMTEKIFGAHFSGSLRWKRVRGSELTKERLQEYLNNLLTPSLFSESEALWISELEKLKPPSEELLVQAAKDRPTLEAPLVLWGAKAPARSSLKKLLEQQSSVLTFPALQPAELKKWTVKRMKEVGIKEFEEVISDLLIELAEGDLDRLEQKIQQLRTYAGETATQKSLTELFPGVSSPSEFQLQDQITSGKIDEADQAIGELLRQGKSPFFLLAILSRSFRTLAQVVSLHHRRKSPQQIAEILSLKPWLVKKHLSQAKRYTPQRLHSILFALLESENRLKAKSLGPELIFSQLVRRLHP